MQWVPRVHGFGASIAYGRKNLADLSQDFEVSVIALLEYGRSEIVDTSYGANLRIDWAHDFI